VSRPRKRERGVRGAGSVYKVERARKNGAPRTMWVAAVTYRDTNTKRLRRVVAYATSQEAATTKLQELYRSPAVASRIAAQRGSLAEFLERWLASVKPSLRPSTISTYEVTRDAHVLPYPIARKDLGRLTSLDFVAHDELLRKAGASGRTRRKAHDLLSAGMKQAVKWKAIATNPLEGVGRPVYDAPPARALKPAQVPALLAAARGDRLEALYVTAVFSGLRSGELLAMRWADVDFKAGAISVRRSLQDVDGKPTIGQTKTAKSERLVALPKLALAALRAHRKAAEFSGDADLVFANENGGPIARQNLLRRSFYPLLERARLVDKGKPLISFHGLRHTHATMLLHGNAHPKIVQERLGHSRIGVTLDTYSHTTPGLQAAAVRQLDATYATRSATRGRKKEAPAKSKKPVKR